MEILKTEDRVAGYSFFLDDRDGVVADLTKCISDDRLTLFEVKYLCDNITSLKENEEYYYIDNYKYLSKSDMKKYLEETFLELEDTFKGRTYLSLKHIGKYSDRSKTYKKLLEEIELNNYKITGIPVEQYITGNWNEEDENKFITNIMIPICINA